MPKLSAQEFKDRLSLHKHDATPLTKQLDLAAIHRKSQLLRCFPGSYARATFGVRVWKGEELVTAGAIVIVFKDPRFAYPPTKAIAEAQQVMVEQEVKAQYHHLDWSKDLRVEIVGEPKIKGYYAESMVKRDKLKPLLMDTFPVALPSPGCVTSPSDPQGRRGFSEDTQAQETQAQESALVGDKPQSKNAQPPSTQELTQAERTPSAREVLARMAAEAREKRGIQKS